MSGTFSRNSGDTPMNQVLTAMPVYNEIKLIGGVLDEVLRFCPDVLTVNDGSTDGTADYLRSRGDIRLVNHERNRGYGAALKSAFDYAREHRFDILVTIDADGQHDPNRIPKFAESAANVDIVSGSRYLREFPENTPAPAQRRAINERVTAELNRRLGFQLTDAFCGFKAYRVEALKHLDVNENGYAMPLELWVKAAAANLSVVEVAVPRIYLDANRTFGGVLDDAETRLEYYHLVIDRSIAAAEAGGGKLRRGTLCAEPAL
jgi:glycosyltransferase involved in cell wall biosynthesis